LLPFDQALLVGGFPAAQSFLMLGTFGVNVAGNLALVPSIGINGAAASTGVSFLVLASGTWWGMRRLMGVNLAAPRAG
jgi:O-antigen/teichoic acid export membrane protein